MGDTNPLVSVIILSYKAKGTLARAIHSVFMQDYPKIELIVADDASPDFSSQYVSNRLFCCAGDNIVRTKLITSDTNTGTVKNLNRALSVMSGGYFTVLGADDVYADKGCLTAFMETFKRRGDKPLLVTGQAEMCSENLNCVLRVLPDGDAKAILQRENPRELFCRLAYDCCVPIVATCFKREFISRVNAFDDSYTYYEDYPTFLKMARGGIAPAYLDRVTTKHASGGIANGNASANNQRGLYFDRRRMWKKEVNPYRDRLDAVSLERSINRQNAERADFATGVGRSSSKWVRFVNRKTKTIKSFFFSKRLHRAVQSFRLAILLLVCAAGIAASLSIDYSKAIVPILVVLCCIFIACSLWFLLSCICLVIRNRLIK